VSSTYDQIGQQYSTVRRPDAEHARSILGALGDARSVLNVGAGAGSYEPTGRAVVAVEPSLVMIRQRPPGAAPVVRAVAEALPFRDRSFDATLAILTLHHWNDPLRGLAEMRRVASTRVVVFTADIEVWATTWLVRDYFPEIAELDRQRFPSIATVVDALGGAEVMPLPTPEDCNDGYTPAYWKRPGAYLDPLVRSGMSSFAVLPQEITERGLAKLAADLADGTWRSRNADLLDLREYDLGHRLVVARL